MCVNGRVHCELSLPLGSSCPRCGTPLSRGTCRLWPAVRREAARHVKDGTGWGDSSVHLPKTCKGGQAKPTGELCGEAAWVRVSARMGSGPTIATQGAGSGFMVSHRLSVRSLLPALPNPNPNHIPLSLEVPRWTGRVGCPAAAAGEAESYVTFMFRSCLCFVYVSFMFCLCFVYVSFMLMFRLCFV